MGTTLAPSLAPAPDGADAPSARRGELLQAGVYLTAVLAGLASAEADDSA